VVPSPKSQVYTGLKAIEELLNLRGFGAFGQERLSEIVKLAIGIETVMALKVSRVLVHPLLSVTVKVGTKFPWKV
jgi:hypothetical protein